MEASPALFFPFEGSPSFQSLDTPDKTKDFFNSTFPDASEMMPTLELDFAHNATSSLVTVKCFPWVREEDRFALIGDAAHAIVPFFGQGMNCGFEDCAVLNGLMEKFEDNWDRIMPEYQRLRKPDGDAIADLALNNFVEMRDKVADPKFLLQKKRSKPGSAPNIPTNGYRLMPRSLLVRISVTVRHCGTGNRQERIMQDVMSMPDIERYGTMNR